MDKFQRFRREYTGKLISDTPSDPFVKFTEWFEEAVQNEISDPNAMALSTSNKLHEVSSRIVLMKDYSHHGFIFFGGYLSKKAKDIEETPSAHLLFYWAELCRQVRIQGEVKKISSNESDAYFKSRPRGAQISASVSHQSEEIESREVLEKSAQTSGRKASRRRNPQTRALGRLDTKT